MAQYDRVFEAVFAVAGEGIQMRRPTIALLAASSLVALSTSAFAQPANNEPGGTNASEESSLGTADIIVSARRRDESLQEVPQTVNVVTGADLQRLNIRDFRDIQSLVPGLQLSSVNAFTNLASVRGIAFDPVASGNNASVEFYLNDAPISNGFLFKTTFDYGQFELQRGPQGTLRGRASPSGAINVTTRRPDLNEAGAVLNTTFTDRHAKKVDAAINVPIVGDILAVRVAGVYDRNRGNQVRSLYETVDGNISPRPYSENEAIRASVRFEPTDWITINGLYQRLHARDHSYGQVVSESLVDPTPLTPTINSGTFPIVRAFDRNAIDEMGTYSRQDQRVFIANAEIRFAGQKLSYVGSFNKQDFSSIASQDNANFFTPPRIASVTQRSGVDPAGFDQCFGNESAILSTGAYAQCNHSYSTRKSHELRLSSDERIGGILDYVIGGFYDHNDNKSNLTQETPVVTSPTARPVTLATIARTPILRRGTSTEKSLFGNITGHLMDDKLELSGGVRYIDYRNNNALYQSSSAGTVICGELSSIAARCTVTADAQKTHATIYSASVKYRVMPGLMVYAQTGSSWRPGPRAVGNFSFGPNRGGQTARELAFQNLPPERSKSYEIGLKTSFLGGRGRFNLSLYHQDFKDYPFVGPQVFYISTNASGAESVAVGNNPGGFGFISPVSVKVNGVEGELAFQISDAWSLGLNAAYADSKVKNGSTIACTDLNRDGVPDINAALPTVPALKDKLPAGETLATCTVTGRRASVAPKFSANLQSEYDVHVADNVDGFLRGLYSFYGRTDANPDNPIDDVGAYGLLNLYAGLRGKDGSWEISLFAKNVTQERKILTMGGSLVTTSVQVLVNGTTQSSPYRSITTTAPREFGVTAKFSFGSR